MTVRIIKGDARDNLAELPADSFDCIVTSPPYYGLRDYGTAAWEGGDPVCDHKINVANGPKQTGQAANGHASRADRLTREECKCGARRIDAQIGLEPTLDAYLETMVAVCRELRRVLKPSGVFFLNIGDSYANNGCASPSMSKSTIHVAAHKAAHKPQPFKNIPDGLKPKDLCLVPERLGIALQADGWWVRSHIIWHKKNPMPESCTDRPTSAHETIWMLTKSARYFWDVEAVAEYSDTRRQQRLTAPEDHPKAKVFGGVNFVDGGISDRRNIRNVWHVASQPFPGAHFATMPPEIAERCIKAASSEKGCCASCGAPWVRVIDRKTIFRQPGNDSIRGFSQSSTRACSPQRGSVFCETKLLGWQPSCNCAAAELVPARILDPFAGAGTTGLVADRLGRDATLIDLNTSYAEMALNRIKDDAPLFAEVAAE